MESASVYAQNLMKLHQTEANSLGRIQRPFFVVPLTLLLCIFLVQNSFSQENVILHCLDVMTSKVSRFARSSYVHSYFLPFYLPP